jgi:hypothetical protein
VEDLLLSLYEQLTPSGTGVGSAVLARYNDYQSARYKGRTASIRINLISKALQWRVAEINVGGLAFIILDNVDQCNAGLRELLERELSALQLIGSKIMTTSRLPRYEALETMGNRMCDFHAGYFETDLYWHCDRCEQDICESCKGDEEDCRTWYVLGGTRFAGIAANSSFSDPKSVWTQQDFFTIFIDSISNKTMQNFIAWDLEREHGDLNLGTLTNTLEPPLSLFGMAFRKTKPSSDMGREWIRSILDYVGTNVVQVKLALDRIHSSTSPEFVDLSPERLPANVQAIFNAGINAINQQPNSQANLASRSIAIVGKTGTPYEGTPLSELAILLKDRHKGPSSKHLPPRSAEDVLNASRGYLRLLNIDDELHVLAFHRLFYHFVFDEYNEELIMAYSQLRTSKIPRSATFAPKNPQEPPQDTSWADIIEGLKRYQSPELPGTTGLSSAPPFRRESSGLTRSQTFIPTGTAGASSSTGLGLNFLRDEKLD